MGTKKRTYYARCPECGAYPIICSRCGGAGTGSTPFSDWLREQKDIGSNMGYVASNLDYIWQNYRTKQWMLIEEKVYMSVPTWSQTQLFKFLIGRLKYDPKFYGFFLVQFERTSPDDGYTYINHERVTKEMLIKFLRFEYIIPSLVLTNPNKQLIYKENDQWN